MLRNAGLASLAQAIAAQIALAQIATQTEVPLLVCRICRLDLIQIDGRLTS